jgi:hypothetical protein
MAMEIIEKERMLQLEAKFNQNPASMTDDEGVEYVKLLQKARTEVSKPVRSSSANGKTPAKKMVSQPVKINAADFLARLKAGA